MRLIILSLCLICFLFGSLHAESARKESGNRYSYLKGCHPYAPSGNFPKLITPQWIGEEGVDAVVILAIDDMSDPAKYEAYMRPILNQLKKIDGRGPISVMTCNPKPEHPQFSQWLEEGLSIDVHTVDHPCPLFKGGDFKKSKSTYDRCVDLLNEIPGNKPVAYRMPCCDSQNTVSPRFYSEIFNKTTEKGNYLQAASSVLTVFTSDNKNADIPKELLNDSDGKKKFEKYLPNKSQFGNLYLNYIENYPYPYVIDRLCWEFPSLVPSDWSAQNYSKVNNPETLADFKAGLDITVLKKGVLTLTFHPHGWIGSNQMVDFVKYAQEKYGKRVQFLTFPEALQKINENMLGGNPLRNSQGNDNGVRLLDLNHDGFMDVVYMKSESGSHKLVTKIWNASENQWDKTKTPITKESFSLINAHFGLLDDQRTCMLSVVHNSKGVSELKLYTFETGNWTEHSSSQKLAQLFIKNSYDQIAKLTFDDARLGGNENGKLKRDFKLSSGSVRFHDLNNDGLTEIIVNSSYVKCLFQYAAKTKEWGQLPFNLPSNTVFVDSNGHDAGLRFVDVNNDGKDDIVYSNKDSYSVHLFVDMKTGWSRELVSGKRGDKKPSEEIPMIVRVNGANNGVWFSRGFMWVQNEDTNTLPDYLDRRDFKTWLK